ncbi:MAG: intradiol ring-cleavage dioxygenase [Gemmatimonadales bacterium]
MEGDDRPTGRVLTRREVLLVLGLSGAGLLTGCRAAGGARASAVPGCVVRPEQTLGPYFVDEGLERSDIRSDPSTGRLSAGAPLTLAFVVSRVGESGCAPLVGARVEVWQCDADGVYSDVKDPGFDTTGQKFLRGHQLTDAEGGARFTTIYPGWYPGRTVHIHFKIHGDDPAGRGYEFASQIYFDDALTDRVHTAAPYAARGARTTRNANDGIYRRGGRELTVAVAPRGDGYAATFEIGLQV